MGLEYVGPIFRIEEIHFPTASGYNRDPTLMSQRAPAKELTSLLDQLIVSNIPDNMGTPERFDAHARPTTLRSLDNEPRS